jgi:phage-related protein
MFVGLGGAMLKVVFYRTIGGTVPVAEWLQGLPKSDRKAVGVELGLVQEGSLRRSRSLGNGLWEVRCDLPSNRIARVVFFIERNNICVVHGFIKKTQKTPKEVIELALKRMKEMAQ